MDHAPTPFPTLLARAELASADKEWPQAVRRWDEVVAVNPVNGAFWAYLAEARRESGDDRGSIAAEREAYRLGYGYYTSHVAYRIATAHARLGEADDALEWLERAIDGGFQHLADARDNDDFAALRDRPRFREMVGTIDRDAFTRDEGWRFDIRFAAREIRRRAFAPFAVMTEAEFTARIAAIEAAVPTLSDHQVIVELLKLVRLLNDGHARVQPPKDRLDLRVTAPFACFLFEDGLFITATGPDHRDLLGAEIRAIGGHSIPDVLATFDPIMARDNENPQWVKACVVDHLRKGSLLQALGLIPDPAAIPLTVIDRQGTVRDVAIPTSEQDLEQDPDAWTRYEDTLETPPPLTLRHREMPFWFTHLEAESTFYVQFNAVRGVPGESMRDFGRRVAALAEQAGARRFVLDMRWNGGGNTLDEWAMLQHLIASPAINRAGAFFVIIGRNTFSAAQNGSGFLAVHSEAILVGEPTGSSPCFIGETSAFDLPWSRTSMNISDLHWSSTWPGDERIWLPPTLYAPPTFAAYRENRDPAMEAILGWDEQFPARGPWYRIG
ncbi:MAG: tetratricopeptide repeat protein [Thermomicrobiales bacterium]